MSNYVAQLVSAFLATGILKMDGIRGQAGWRYMFLIEGGLTLLIGLASFYMMPPSPTQTRAWYRPKGWFTERYVAMLMTFPMGRRTDVAHAARRPSSSTVCCGTTRRSRTCTTAKGCPSFTS